MGIAFVMAMDMLTVGSYRPAIERGVRLRLKRRKKELTPQERAIKEAERIAKKRVSFVGHAVTWGATIFFLLVTAGFEPALIVAAGWGIGLAIHGYYALVAVELRRRWVQAELAAIANPAGLPPARLPRSAPKRSMEALSASIAHEIRNPITAAKSLVQQMGEDPKAAENVEYAKVAIEELDRVERSISHLLRYAREEDLKVEEILMEDVIDSALETFKDRLSASAIDLQRDIEDSGALVGDPEKLRRVVINLVSNAIDELESSEAETRQIALSAGRNLAGDEVWLRVRDNGAGIEQDRQEKIFSPFHTSKETGTGLGLAISKKLVEAHGGTIELSSGAGGTEFVVTLPTQPEVRG